LFVAALLLLWADGWRPTAWSTPAPAPRPGSGGAAWSTSRVVVLAASVIVIALAVVTVVEVIRIGHSGAEAVWQGVGSS